MNAPIKHRVDQRGFTLIEVMISTVVALFATLAIMQSFAVSEGFRRTATSGGDATFSGAVATYLLGRDLQMAGYGVNTAAYLGCTVSGFDGTLTQPISFTLAPADHRGRRLESRFDHGRLEQQRLAAGTDHADHIDGISHGQLPDQQPVRRDGW